MIGYDGNEGDDPWMFYLEEAGWTSELMYLKLFFSAGYLDLLHIRRDSLFFPKDQHQDYRVAKRRGVRLPERLSERRDGPHLYMPAGPPSQHIGALKIPLIVGNDSE